MQATEENVSLAHQDEGTTTLAPLCYVVAPDTIQYHELPVRPVPIRSYHSLAPIRSTVKLERKSSAPSLSPLHEGLSVLPLPPSVIELRVVLHKDLHDNQLLWLVARRPYKEGFPRTIGHGSNVRISDGKLWVEGTMGKLLALEKKWLVYQLRLTPEETGHGMRIAVPRQWGQVGAMTTLSYMLGTPFLQDTLPLPSDLYKGMMPGTYERSTREELARAHFASELHDVVLDLA